MPDFHAEPYVYLAGLSHKSALIAWGAFYFKVRPDGRAKLVDDEDLQWVHPPRCDSIGCQSKPYGPADVEVRDASGTIVARAMTNDTNHCAISGLQANTSYSYTVRVKHEVWASGLRWDWDPEAQGLVQGQGVYRNEFRTLPDPTAPLSEPFTFAVIGDFGTGVRRPSTELRRQREVALALQHAVDAHDVRLILTTGDNIYATRRFLLWTKDSGGEDDDWFFTFFQPYRYAINRVPVCPSFGNHDSAETEEADDREQVFDNFYLRERLATEEAAGRASLSPGLFYRFRVSDEVEFVCIDTSKEHFFRGGRLFEYPKHREFLRRAFPAAPEGSIRWRIPFCHHPPFCAGPLHGNTDNMGELIALLEGGGVRACFSGHEHNFQHSHWNGVDYFVSGGGGKVRPGPPRRTAEAHTVSWASACHFLLVTIHGAVMTVRAIGDQEDGRLKDIDRVDLAGNRVSGPIVVGPPRALTRAPRRGTANHRGNSPEQATRQLGRLHSIRRKDMVRLRFRLVTLILVLALPSTLRAQAVKGTLLGNITDPTGLGLPGATITITEQNTNITYSVPANESGYYTFPNLKDGTYKVEAELAGFRKAIRDGVEVKVNTTVRVDLNLEVGNVEESVTVAGESPVLQTDRADTGRVIEAVHLQEVPLGFNRNFQGMLITVPGATRPFRPHSDFFNAQDSLSTNVNGQSRLANNVQIEGIDDNHRTGLLTTLIPAADAIETVSITTSAYDAEFGRAGGAITNVTLRSGTNKYKGSVFAFGNNESTNAKNFFTHSNPPTSYLQSGFTLGGPIQRNRLFFFGDYQHTRDHAGRTTRATIPPMAFRTGDFSAASTIIYDPATGNTDGTGRVPFSGNIVPPERISPIAKAILANLPAPNIDAPIGQANYQIDYARVKTTDSFDTKINAQISQRDQVSARLSFLRPKLTDPPAYGAFGDSKQGSPSGNGFAGIGTDTTYSTGVNYTRTWSSTLVMEARAGMNYFHNEALSGGAGLTTAKDVGILGANIDDWTSGITSIDIGNGMSSPMVGFAASLPWDRSERTVQFATVFTKLKGNHTIKFGEDFRHTRDFLLQTQDNGGPRGQFQFRGGRTSIPGDAAGTAGFANAFASFLLDVPSQVQRDLKVVDPGVRFWAFFTFVQDKWQVTKDLTVDLGLRHEYYTPFIGLVDKGGLSNYDPATNTLQVAGYGDVSQSVGVKSYWKNFGPRVGVSYRFNDKTVARGGYGVSTLPFPDNSYVYNFPIKQNNVFTSANGFVAAGAMKNGFPDPIVAAIPSNGIIDAGTSALRAASFFHVKPDMHEGSLHSFNLAVQRELPGRLTLDVAYVGNRGHDVQTQFNENAATVLGLNDSGRPLFARFNKTATVTTWIPTKTSYNSLQMKLDRRFSAGLLLTTSYTLGRGKSYTNGDSNSGISTPADIQRSWARTDQDRLHTFVESFVYQLPAGPGRRWMNSGVASQILGGWQVSGFFTAQSGTPVDITMDAALLRAPGNTQRPDVNATPEVLGGIGPGNPWFDISVFSRPAENTFGNAPRNGVLDGPKYVNLDATIAKLFALPRGARGEFRVDVFNFTNSVHFNNPNGTYLGSTFAQISSAFGERFLRFGLKVTF